MGRGDKKTKKGKMFMGSYGVSRPKNPSTTTTSVATTAKEVTNVTESTTETPKAAKPKATPKPKI